MQWNQIPGEKVLCTFKLIQGSLQDKQVDVPRLASEYHLIIITLKSAKCPVCPQLLKILNVYGLDTTTSAYVDPYTQKVWEIDQDRKRVIRRCKLDNN